MSEKPLCQADDFAGTMCCGRCNLSWPTTAKGDDIPLCKDKADPPIKLSEMRDVVEARANDEVFSQIAIVKTGLSAPMHDRLRRIAVLRAAAMLIEKLEQKPGLLRQVMEG